jgi:hypothetical protein
MAGPVLFGWGYSIGAVTPTDKDAYQSFKRLPYPKEGYHVDPLLSYEEFSAPIYSLDTFLPIINLGQKDHWRPNPHEGCWGSGLRRYLWIHIERELRRQQGHNRHCENGHLNP